MTVRPSVAPWLACRTCCQLIAIANRTRHTHTPGSSTEGMGRAPSGPTDGLRHQRYISMPSAVTANAPRATAKDTSGAPPYRARPNMGLSPCPNATRPHGNPPNGTLALPHSVADHAAANHNGQPGRFRTATASSPNRATHSAHNRDSANQGTAPTS
ncbi:Uncharacterised protein [Mycobacteroides abscessus subsp. abscessus]|nr:Uncharacterised protein [Mycobacteroides abscessus subsp. abscessus]